MKIILTPTPEWAEFDKKVIDSLLERGIFFHIFKDGDKMSVILEVAEWEVFLKILWHVWADMSRSSDYGRYFKMKYKVEVLIECKRYEVGIRISPKGILYGSIAC